MIKTLEKWDHQEKKTKQLFNVGLMNIFVNFCWFLGSPFILDIVDASSVSVYGENLRMASVGKLSTFMIHAVGADSKDLTVTIQGTILSHV